MPCSSPNILAVTFACLVFVRVSQLCQALDPAATLDHDPPQREFLAFEMDCFLSGNDTVGAMDTLQSMKVFVRVAQRAGFAAAGRDLRMSPAGVTKNIATLEARVGA